MIKEPVTKALNLVGNDLDFGEFSIKGIPGFNINLLHRGEDVVKLIEVPIFNFRISTSDSLESNIVKDMVFTFSDGIYVYVFKVETNPLPDLTGWSKLNVNYISKEPV